MFKGKDAEAVPVLIFDLSRIAIAPRLGRSNDGAYRSNNAGYPTIHTGTHPFMARSSPLIASI